MYKEFIGKRSKSVTNIVERGAVRNFATALGDSHPLYIDEEFAKQTIIRKTLHHLPFQESLIMDSLKDFSFLQAGSFTVNKFFIMNVPLWLERRYTVTLR